MVLNVTDYFTSNYRDAFLFVFLSQYRSYVWLVSCLRLYRSFTANFLLTGFMSYIGSGFFETWCLVVDKDSLLLLKQITFTLLLAFHRSAGNVLSPPPFTPNHTICMHASMFTLDTPFIRTNDNPISYRLFA